MAAATVTLLSKPGCHLCDDARAVVAQVTAALAEDGLEVAVIEQSILDDPKLDDTFSDDIPVVFIGDAFHAQWRIDPHELRTALLAAIG